MIGKILPIEGYCVHMKGSPPVDYALSLTHLYQPLLGIEAISLYQTLLHEGIVYPNPIKQTHHTLMNYLQMPLDKLYESRLKLEGIGLLKTYEHEEEKGKYYTYVLYPPFSPESFFHDPMLSELLYHHIGHEKFASLKQYLGKVEEDPQGKDITATFPEVFQTFQPAYDKSFKKERTYERNKMETIDFTWIERLLKQRMIPVNKVLTPRNKKLIVDMMQLYDLFSTDIEKCILWSLTDDYYLDEEEFKAACHDLFKTKYNYRPIQLTTVHTAQSEDVEADVETPKSKEELLIERLETISPKQLLESLSKGNQASEQDMKIIQEVMTSQNLPIPVMNVLIHYVLLQSNMRLSKSYLETIASHWSRLNLKTAKEAMDFAKKQITSSKRKATKPSYRRREQYTKEVIPDWFYERDRLKAKKETKKDHLAEKELAKLIEQFADE